MFRKRISSASARLTHVMTLALLLNSTCSPLLAMDQQNAGAPLTDDFRNYTTSEHTFVHQFLKSGEYMPVSDIKQGMEGYGLTVFQGTKIERFNVKVIGTVKKVLNNRDAILVRLSGGQMAKNNVIKGMSGSPVYIGGKLIGAISYGFDFSMEPIAGVTPIVDMLDALAQDTAEHPSAPDRISKLDLPTLPQSVMQTAGGQMPTTVAGAAPHMVPLMAPVALAGFSTRAEKFLSERFNEVGLYCSSGASGGMDESLAKTPKATSKEVVAPGSAVAVMLTTGDFNTSACGTATASFNGKVLAFGHPFLQAGFVDFPMASAYIHQVMPSLAVSFKVSSPMQVLGSIVSDRPWAVGGQIGKTAHMIPATYNVIDETRHLQHTYHCNIVDHPDLTPELMAATAMSAIDATHQSQAPYILKVASTIETTSGAVIQRTDRYPTNFSAHTSSLDTLSKFRTSMDPVGGYLLSTANKIMDNEFQRASIKSINLQIALEDGHKAAKLERIYVDNPIVEPGDTVKVNCVIRPYDKERVTKTIDLQIPRDVPDGNILLAVSSGDEVDMLRKRLGLVDPPPENLNQVLNKIRNRGRGDTLCAMLALPEQSINLNGVTLLNPPAHWNKLFFSDRYTRGPALTRGEIRVSSIQDYLLDGAHVMTVEVRRKDKASARSQPYMPQGGSTSSAVDAVSMTDLAKKTIGKVDTTSTTTTTSTSTTASTASSNQSSTATTDKTPAAPAANPYWTASSKDYPHMRSVQLWRQESESEFRNGKTDSTTIDSWGRIIPGFQNLDKDQVKNDMRIWSSTWANGSFWFSTSNKVYKWNGDHSAPVVVANLDGVAIPSLVADSKGILYAAVIPGSNVYSIDPSKPINQNIRLVAKLAEPLVTSLAIDKKDNLFIGVTGSGKVYKLPVEKGATPVSIFDSGQADIVSMFYCAPEDRLYVGTAEKGAVYSIDANGKTQAEYQSPDHIVSGIAKDKKGNLFVATAGSGHLVKVNGAGEVETLATSEAFYTLYYDSSTDHVFSGDAEGDITEAQFDSLSQQSYFIPVCHTEQDAVVALCSDGKGRLFAGTCNLAVAQIFEMRPALKASYTSEVHDGLRSSRWSRLRAYGGYNEVSEAIRKAVAVETRTGQTSQPDSSWSEWAEANPAPDAYELKSPPGRYLQYRLAWKSDDQSSSLEAPASSFLPRLSSDKSKGRPVAIGKVDVTYLPNNTAPLFTAVSLKSGTAVNGKEEISVTGSDSDGDNLMLAMQISPDGGKTWQSIVSDLRTKHAAAKEEPTPTVTASSTAETSTTVDKDDAKTKSSQVAVPKTDDALPPQVQPPGGPPKRWDPEQAAESPLRNLDDKVTDENKTKEAATNAAKVEPATPEHKSQKLASDKTAVSKKKSKSKTKLGPSANASAVTTSSDVSTTGEKFTVKWDTAKVKEGNYIVKFTLDDKLSNAETSEQSSVFRTIDVDNSPPKILSVKWSNVGKGAAQLRIEAKDQYTPIMNGTYKLDDGEPLALAGINDAGDGLDVLLGADNVTFAKHPKKVEIRISDRAGNTVTKTVDVN